MTDTQTWEGIGSIKARSVDTPTTYDAITYTVVIHAPGLGPIEMAGIVPSQGMRLWDDTEVEIQPCPLGMEFPVTSVRGRLGFWFAERPATATCEELNA